jgi:meromycolic acid enoyl-[acyl-carrier-protein] reductase
MLEGSKLLITGVATRTSIAFEVAKMAQESGAEVVLTSFGRVRRLTERTAAKLDTPVDVLELDVNNPEDFAALTADLEGRWGRVDGVLHAVAFAPEDALGGRFMSTPAESAMTAFKTSAFSFKAIAEACLPLMRDGGGSIVGLDFDATVAWPIYDWMGVSKAGLEAVSRYLARYLGEHDIRVNCVAAGPIRTMAGKSIPGFNDLAQAWSKRAPLGWDTSNAEPIGRAACYLLSDWSRGVTGEILHVDGGYHAMGANLQS